MKIAYFSLAGLPDFKEHGDFSIFIFCDNVGSNIAFTARLT